MHKCNGKWALIPELSFYQEGEPPRSCVYEISDQRTEVQFKLTWTQQDGKEMAMNFGGKADSEPREVEAPAGAKASYTMVDDHILESRMFMHDQELAYAKRSVSDDGQLMSVLQVNTNAEGEKIRITQVDQRL